MLDPPLAAQVECNRLYMTCIVLNANLVEKRPEQILAGKNRLNDQ